MGEIHRGDGHVMINDIIGEWPLPLGQRPRTGLLRTWLANVSALPEMLADRPKKLSEW
jgi:hypothetical protein